MESIKNPDHFIRPSNFKRAFKMILNSNRFQNKKRKHFFLNFGLALMLFFHEIQTFLIPISWVKKRYQRNKCSKNDNRLWNFWYFKFFFIFGQIGFWISWFRLSPWNHRFWSLKSSSSSVKNKNISAWSTKLDFFSA